MACIKLDILDRSYSRLKVVYRKAELSEKGVQRFLSVDPLTQNYPELTPYQFASNTPIWAVDLDGLEALVSSDYSTLEALKKSINIKYDKDDVSVTVSHTFNNASVTKILGQGIRERDLRQLQSGSFSEKVSAVFNNPSIIYHERVLKGSLILAYKKSNITDIGNYHVAQIMANNLAGSASLSHQNSEKGLVNTFNHILGQAVLTIFYGASSADYVGDAHERGQPSLMTGAITEAETMQAIDNYVDLINNQWGQTLGNELRQKYGNIVDVGGLVFDGKFNENLVNTNLANVAGFLNDVQNYVGNTFGYTGKAFSSTDEIVKQYTTILIQMRYGESSAKIFQQSLPKKKPDDRKQ